VKWTVQTSILTCDLSAPGDWFKTHAEILKVMGIKDADPVTSEAHAQMIGDAAQAKALAKRRARSGAATR
jgi:hypothetical protein